MIITKISDGLGNQLFMYACGYAMAKRLSTKLILDITYLSTNNLRRYELNKLNITYNKLFTVDNIKYPINIIIRKLLHIYILCRYKIIKENIAYKYDDNISKICNNSYLYGYWQSEKYFLEYRDDILKMFTPKNGLSKTYNHYIGKIRNSNSVSVHIRRGDYEKLGICLDISYYKNALKLLNSKHDNLIYFVFSDNEEYAKHLFEEIDGIFVYIKKLSSDSTLDDFFLMKECKHNIIANSSYSWWAAWLNENPNKIVIHPNDKKIYNDFYPIEWITID